MRIVTASAVAVLLGLLGSRLLVPASPLGSALSRLSYDGYYAWLGIGQGALAAEGAVVVVYLDLDSFRARGLPATQPWPRQLHGQLLRRLTAAGARAVVFDILFDAAEPESPADREFTRALRESGRVILAAELSAASAQPGRAEWGRTTQVALPAGAFRSAARAWGLSNLLLDDDFVARRHWPGRLGEGPAEPSLTWATAAALELAPGIPEVAARPQWVRYYGPPFAIPHLSYSQALDPAAADDAVFRDRIVFVGARPMAGPFMERRDELRSPFRSWRTKDRFMPGVEVHATQMLNLLRGDWLSRPAAAFETGVVLLAALAGAGLFWLRPVPASFVTLGLMALVTACAAALFQGWNLWFPWLVPVAVQWPLGLGGAVLFHSIEWRRLRRRLEAAKRAADLRIREQAALIDKAHDAILVQDLHGQVLYANPSAEALYGWSLTELQAGHAAPLFSDQNPAMLEARRLACERGEWQGELGQQTRAGRTLTVESRCSLIRDDAGQPKALLLINRDVTAERQFQAEALRLQRMEGIGAIAGGIAHDLNNALAPVLLGAQILRREVASGELERLLGLMEASARRGTEMVRQVLLFARGRDGDQQRLDPRQLLEEMAKLARDTFPRHIQVEAYAASDLWPVRGNATELYQVLLNLCVNARDAMPGGGTLSLIADNVELGPREVRDIPSARPGSYVAFMVSDTGTGIPPEVLPRIFEPFYTTKPEGVGTGLGLSTASRIIRAHGGVITVKPGTTEGTTFEVFLPRLEDKAPPSTASHPTPPARGCGELVLVADDEQAIRELLRRGLEDHGYRVITASDGAEAVSRFLERSAEVALVILDARMPSLDGPAALERMRATKPGLRALLLSGGDGPAVRGAGGGRAGDAVLGKPIELPDLLDSVAELLATSREEPHHP